MIKKGDNGWPSPWGPHCLLRQERHPEPFSKRRDGRDRRAARLHKQMEREFLLRCRDYDDGYFPLGGLSHGRH